jgi:head-tail adaptor
MTTAVPVRWPETGELNRRVTIRRWTDKANAGFGIDQLFDAGIVRWAKIAPFVGVAYWGTKQVGEEVTHRIWLRYGDGTRPQDITNQHVIDHIAENRRYRVVRTTNASDAGQFVMVECKDLGAIS